MSINSAIDGMTAAFPGLRFRFYSESPDGAWIFDCACRCRRFAYVVDPKCEVVADLDRALAADRVLLSRCTHMERAT